MKLIASIPALLLSLAAAGCADATSSQTAAVEQSCDTWTVGDAISMWPPDHTMHHYSLDDCVTVVPTACPPPSGVCGDGIVDLGEECDDANLNPFDGCDLCRLTDPAPDLLPTAESSALGLSITSITSNESIDGTGDGHTIGDSIILDATTFELRAERDGGGSGRRYHVNFVDANDEAGACVFVVPHDLAAR